MLENLVQLFVLHLAAETDAEPVEQSWQCLDLQERRRADRFLRQCDRDTFVLSHAMVRHVLSKQCGVSPAELVIGRHPCGKPFLERPQATNLHFSMAHTRGCSVCAVNYGHRIGVDLECVSPALDTAVIKAHFGKAEHEHLNQLPHEQARIAVCIHWTLKEAFAKGLGIGLTMPLAHAAFKLRRGHASAAFTGALAEHQGKWQFWQRRLKEDYVAAIAVEAPAAKLVRVRVKAFVLPRCAAEEHIQRQG